MVTEDYVSFEIAKLLKEKGFDDCANSFLENGNMFPTCIVRRKEHYPAPTLQMAMKWLREKHNIFIEISVDEYGYQWALFDNTTKRIRPYVGWSDTYKQSCEAAIKYCLEKLI